MVWYVLFSLRYLRDSNRLQGTALAMRENCQKNYPIYSVGPIRWRGQLVTGLKATAAYQIARSWSWSMPGPRAKSHEIFMRGNQWKITNTVLHTKNNRKLRDVLAMSHDNEWSIEYIQDPTVLLEVLQGDLAGGFSLGRRWNEAHWS